MASLGQPVLALLGKGLVADFFRHAFHHSQGGEVDPSHMRRHAEPLDPFKPFQQDARVGHRSIGVLVSIRHTDHIPFAIPVAQRHGEDGVALYRGVEFLQELRVPGALPVAVDHIHVTGPGGGGLIAGRG